MSGSTPLALILRRAARHCGASADNAGDESFVVFGKTVDSVAVIFVGVFVLDSPALGGLSGRLRAASGG